MSIYYLFCIKKNTLYKYAECVSRHRTYSAASNKEAELNRKIGSHCSNYIELIDSDELESRVEFEVSKIYKKVIDRYLDEKKRRRLISLLADIIESERSDEGIRADLVDRLECWQISLEELKASYMDDAIAFLDDEKKRAQLQAAEEARRKAVINDLAESRSEMSYSFPAVRGIQAGKEYYTAQVPYKYLVKLFVFDEDDVLPPELRAQRILNETRARDVGQYIGDNKDSYVLPAITASVSAEMKFEAVPVSGAADRLGILHIPMDATLLINDGQHRRKGIELALVEHPELAEESICVTIYFDEGLERSQQMFADINGNHVRPSSAINALYNHRDGFNRWILELLDLMPKIKSRIEMEKSSVGKKSFKLWSLIGFRKFVTQLTGISSSNYDERIQESSDSLSSINSRIVKFMDYLESIPQWKAMLSGTISAFEVREQYVIGHAVFLEALGMLGGQLICDKQADSVRWNVLKNLKGIDPNRSSKAWEGRCVVLGKMQKTRDGVKSTAALLFKICNLPLTPELVIVESHLSELRAA